MFQHPAFADLGAHPCFEEAIGIAAFGLGTVEGGVGMGEKRLTIRGIVRIERDADAGRDAKGLRRIVCCAQGFQDSLGQPACRVGIHNSRH